MGVSRSDDLAPRLFMTPLKHNSSLTPILAAEAGSTAVSLAALGFMERYPTSIRGLKEQLARTTIYPTLARKHPEQDPQTLMDQAEQRASLLIKGTAMMGAGFLSHLPIQMAMEGRLSGEGLKHAAVGKGVGVGVALGSIMVVDKIAPNALPALQNAIYPLVKPLLPKDEKDRDSRNAEEIAKLLILDVPSSIAAGLINYKWAKAR